MPESKPRKPKLSGEQRKEKILQAATEVFSRRGFSGTTIRQLAKQAGVSEAMIYHHFPGKEALYDAILERRIEENKHLYFPKKAARSKADRRLMQTIIRNFLTQQAQNTGFLRMILFSALEGHELAQKFVRGPLQDFFRFLGSYVDERVRDGAFKPISGQLAARLLMGMVFHFVLLREVLGDPSIQETDTEEVIHTVVGLFLDGIRENPDTTS